MSAYVSEDGEFIKFYGTTIMAPVGNVSDFVPLFSVLEKYDNIKLVRNLNLRIFDVFSQTLAAFVGDSCKRIEEWFTERNQTYHPYEYLDYDVILPTHYAAKSIIRQILTGDIVIKNARIEVDTKLNIVFSFDENTKKMLRKIIVSLNDLYGVKRYMTRRIVLGHLKSLPFNISPEDIDNLNKLVPKTITFKQPDVYHYNTVDKFRLYSDSMN